MKRKDLNREKTSYKCLYGIMFEKKWNVFNMNVKGKHIFVYALLCCLYNIKMKAYNMYVNRCVNVCVCTKA